MAVNIDWSLAGPGAGGVVQNALQGYALGQQAQQQRRQNALQEQVVAGQLRRQTATEDREAQERHRQSAVRFFSGLRRLPVEQRAAAAQQMVADNFGGWSPDDQRRLAAVVPRMDTSDQWLESQIVNLGGELPAVHTTSVGGDLIVTDDRGNVVRQIEGPNRPIATPYGIIMPRQGGAPAAPAAAAPQAAPLPANGIVVRGAGDTLPMTEDGAHPDFTGYVPHDAPAMAAAPATPGMGAGSGVGAGEPPPPPAPPPTQLTFAPPVNSAPGSPYSNMRHIAGRAPRAHRGTDYPAPAGTPVGASADGEVVFAGPRGEYGNLVIVRHPGGYETRYGHLGSIGVQVGDTVSAGQPLGGLGRTGNATGNNVHFEIRDPQGRPINPASMLGRQIEVDGAAPQARAEQPAGQTQEEVDLGGGYVLRPMETPAQRQAAAAAEEARRHNRTTERQADARIEIDRSRPREEPVTWRPVRPSDNAPQGVVQISSRGEYRYAPERATRQTNMPANVANREDVDVQRLSTARDMQQRLGTHLQRIRSGEMVFSPTANARANPLVQGVFGSTANTRNIADFRADVESLTNAILQMNVGPQTDSDARRARDEIFNNLSDSRAVERGLQRLAGIQRRAEGLLLGQINRRRSRYGDPAATIADLTGDLPEVYPTAPQARTAPRPAAAPAGRPAPQRPQAANSRGSGGSLPPAARQALREGHNTTFGNGQTWTLRGGRPVRVR